jgi:hypothetical protein
MNRDSMPKKNVTKNAPAKGKAPEKKASKMGLYRAVAGLIMLVVGVLLVVMNLTAVLMAVVGLVLVYYGLKVIGGMPSRLLGSSS